MACGCENNNKKRIVISCLVLLSGSGQYVMAEQAQTIDVQKNYQQDEISSPKDNSQKNSPKNNSQKNSQKNNQTFSTAGRQDEVRPINIPQQPLAEALIDFSKQVGRVVVGIPGVLSSHQSTAVVGNYTADQALAILLSNTGLLVKPNEKGYVIVKPGVKARKHKEVPITREKLPEYIEEVLVFGQDNKRPHNFALNTSHLSGQFLEKNHIDSVADVAAKIVNVSATPNGDSFVNIGIRGVTNLGDSFQGTPPNAFHYNGVYKSPHELPGLSFFDVDSLEVHKGPLFTNPGRSAVSGGISLTTKAPRLGVMETRSKVTYGSYNHRSIQGVLNVPVTSDFALRLSGSRDLRDGYTETWGSYRPLYESTDEPLLHYPTYDLLEPEDIPIRTSPSTDIHDYDNSDKGAWRLSGLWLVEDKFSWLVRAENHIDHSTREAFIDPFVIENFERAVVVGTPAKTDSDIRILSSDLTTHFFDNVLNYKFAWSENDFSRLSDTVFGRREFLDTNSIPYHNEKLLSHNLELHSHIDEDGWEWLIATYKENYQLQRDWIDLDSTFSDIYGMFAAPLGHGWRFLFGSRYINTEQSIKWFELPRQASNAEPVFAARKKWSKPVYSYSLEYESSDELKMLVTYGSGLRFGVAENEEYGGEHANRSFEWRMQGKHLEEELKWALSWHLASHENMQVWGPKFDENDVYIRPEVQSIAHADIEGWDFEIAYEKENFGNLFFSFAYLNTKITELEIPDDYAIVNHTWNPAPRDRRKAGLNFRDLRGNQLPNSPETSLTLSYEYPWLTEYGTWEPHIGIQYSDGYYLDLQNRDAGKFVDKVTGGDVWYQISDFAYQSAYTLLDLSLSWTSPYKKYRMEFYIDNATDEKIRTQYMPNFFSTKGLPSSYYKPRTYGLSFSVNL